MYDAGAEVREGIWITQEHECSYLKLTTYYYPYIQTSLMPLPTATAYIRSQSPNPAGLKEATHRKLPFPSNVPICVIIAYVKHLLHNER
jgi:hypothetical protein